MGLYVGLRGVDEHMSELRCKRECVSVPITFRNKHTLTTHCVIVQKKNYFAKEFRGFVYMNTYIRTHTPPPERAA